MSDRTEISWTDATWNPVRGCTKVSAGCKHCYAERFAERFRGVPGHPFEQGFDVRLVPEALDLPLRWRKPRRIFVNSMSDLFHEDVPVDFIAEVFGVMAVAGASEPNERESAQVKAGDGGAFHGPSDGYELIAGGPYRHLRFGHGPHTFQLLSKRPERMAHLLNMAAFREKIAGAACRWAHDRRDAGYLADCISGQPSWYVPGSNGRMWPLSNAWLGVSVEDQAAADERIPHLLATPAAVRFVSAEPLLGPVDLRRPLEIYGHVGPPCCTKREGWHRFGEQTGRPVASGLHWVIAGGESGPGARPCALEWISSLVAQCKAARVPVFVKQLGAYVVSEERTAPAEAMAHPDRLKASDRAPNGEVWAWRMGTRDRAGRDPAEWPEDLRVREFPRETP